MSVRPGGSHRTAVARNPEATYRSPEVPYGAREHAIRPRAAEQAEVSCAFVRGKRAGSHGRDYAAGNSGLCSAS
ncbi:hypothetical protein GCM10023335_78300 [Streptomyces siamensis]|uniref:Uncharacterized protein n=1 Tax=Streptomyces siamensis TaxID=1274986 RepID=A0ABP9JJM1_9ACTN